MYAAKPVEGMDVSEGETNIYIYGNCRLYVQFNPNMPGANYGKRNGKR